MMVAKLFEYELPRKFEGRRDVQRPSIPHTGQSRIELERVYVVEDRVMKRGEHLGSWVVIRQGSHLHYTVSGALLFSIKPGSILA